nr:5-formyltetrahydrofolate cyclo-ligase [Govania unica]
MRSDMKARRVALSRKDNAADEAARHMLFALGAAEVLSGACVAVYWPLGDELSTFPLIDLLEIEGFSLALPVVTARDAPLEFRAWVPGESLVEGHHGVRVPPDGAAVVRPDVIVTPLLAFDDLCMRLGYGGGYYDRTLVQLRGDGGARIRAYGFAYDEQHVSQVPVTEEDAHLDGVVTDKAMYWRGKDVA